MTPAAAGLTLALALLVAGCGGAARSSGGGGADAPGGLRVTRGVLEDRIILTGEVEATSSDNLVAPRTPGWIVSIRWLAEDGAQVKKGDRVVEFDTSSFTSALDDKRLLVTSARNTMAAELARGTGSQTEKAMEVERKRAEMAKAKVEAGVPADLFSRRDHQQKQLAELRQKDALAKAQEDLASTRKADGMEAKVKAVALARAERELRDMEARLDDLTLRATRDGLVLIGMSPRDNRKYLLGDQAYSGYPVASMPASGTMQVRARLSDVDDGAVRAGMRADCVLDAYPRLVFTGTVREVSPVARPDGRDGVRRFFDVLAPLEGGDQKIVRPGMSARVEVVRRRAVEALIVPRVAVRPGVAGAALTWPGKALVARAGGSDEAVELQWCNDDACVVRGGVLEGMLLASGERPR